MTQATPTREEARMQTKDTPLLAGDARHGTVNGYVNHRCRCTECRAANALRTKLARYKKRKVADLKMYRDGEATYLHTDMWQTDFATLLGQEQGLWLRLIAGPLNDAAKGYPVSQLASASEDMDLTEINQALRSLEKLGIVSISDEYITFPNLVAGTPAEYAGRN